MREPEGVSAAELRALEREVDQVVEARLERLRRDEQLAQSLRVPYARFSVEKDYGDVVYGSLRIFRDYLRLR